MWIIRAFGVPLLGRWLVAHGYRTGIVAQPVWKDEAAGVAAVSAMGRPRLFAGVSAGALDSMLAHYTAFRRKRHDDAYTPGGKAGARPNRAVIVYANLVRRAFPGLPLTAGGIEASLRRITHYDFWSDELRRSLLFDARLDLLFWRHGRTGDSGNGPPAGRCSPTFWGDLSVLPADELWPISGRGIHGTARLVRTKDLPAIKNDGGEYIELPSHETMLAVPRAYLEGSLLLERKRIRCAVPSSSSTATEPFSSRPRQRP